MFQLISVGLGGFVGACARFGLTKLLDRLTPFFPFGTLASNVIAGLLIGLIAGFEFQGDGVPDKAKLFLVTGLLGGLSTFSAFSLETIYFIRDECYLKAGANVVANVGVSLLAVLGGLLVAKAMKNFL